MIDYHDNGDGYNYSVSMFPPIPTGENIFVESLPAGFDDDYSLDVGGLDNFVYDDNYQSLPLLDQPGDEPPPLFLPGFDAELDREMSMLHLLKAYGEASENASTAELARVILARLREKSSPVGGAVMERIGHYLSIPESGGGDPQTELLAHESAKSYPLALQAFYETTPYGRFAHFAANTAVRESVPRGVVSVHIIDFDVGEGVQWPPLLAALGPQRSVRITSCIGRKEEEEDQCYVFERTKKWLLGFVHGMRLELRVDRMRVEELLFEKSSTATAAVTREWLVFNCMAGLPHMNHKNVASSQLEMFINVARELIVNNGRRGVLIYESGHGSFDPSSSRRFSDGHLHRAHALFESLEWHFPSPPLSVARTAMESLFVGPCVMSSAEVLGFDAVGAGLEGLVFSEQSLMEAEEIVRRAGAQHYGVEVGGCANEMVLLWRGTPLVRVCAWR